MKYQANPVIVDVFKIVEIHGQDQNGNTYCTLEDGQSVVADTGMAARYIPKIGDYWVIQADGYVYLNPKDVFERKYSPVPT